MIYILNKSKMISYIVASFTVIILFVFSTSIIPNKDIELIKVSTNINENSNMVENNIYNNY